MIKKYLMHSSIIKFIELLDFWDVNFFLKWIPSFFSAGCKNLSNSPLNRSGFRTDQLEDEQFLSLWNSI